MSRMWVSKNIVVEKKFRDIRDQNTNKFRLNHVHLTVRLFVAISCPNGIKKKMEMDLPIFNGVRLRIIWNIYLHFLVDL